MSHAEHHPGINQRIAAPELAAPPAKQPEVTGGSGSTSGNHTQGSLDPRDPNFFKKHWKKFLGGGAILLAGGGVVYGVATGIKGDAPAQPGPVPVEPGELPGESPEQPGTPELGEQYTVEALQLPAGLGAGELGELIVEDRFNQWIHAGIEPALMDEFLTYNGTHKEFGVVVAERYREVFAVALFGEGYKDNANIAAYVDDSVTAHAFNVEAYLTTLYHEKATEPYEANYIVDGAAVNETPATGGRTLEVPFDAQSNSDKSGGMVIDTIKPGVYTFTISESGSTPIITQVLSRTN